MILAGFLLGLLSSWHCLGMCGPLTFAVASNFRISHSPIPWFIPYHTGRVLMYGGIGAILGIVGLGVNLVGYQKWISILLGLGIILYFLLPSLFKLKKLGKWLYAVPHWFSSIWTKVIKRTSLTGLFLSGALNGLLPCGLVYLALAGAITQPSPFASFYYMMAFGAGTIPLLVFSHFPYKYIQEKFPTLIKRGVPIIACLFGALLIYRGLGHGTFLSPSLVLSELRDTVITVCGID